MDAAWVRDFGKGFCARHPRRQNLRFRRFQGYSSACVFSAAAALDGKFPGPRGEGSPCVPKRAPLIRDTLPYFGTFSTPYTTFLSSRGVPLLRCQRPLGVRGGGLVFEHIWQSRPYPLGLHLFWAPLSLPRISLRSHTCDPAMRGARAEA